MIAWAASMTARSKLRFGASQPATSRGRVGRTLLYRAFLYCVLWSDQAQDHQQDDGADKGINDGADQAAADDNAELRQQPAGDDGADDADDDIADQPKSAALDDHAGEPAGNRADDQPDDDGLCVHECPPREFQRASGP